MYFIYYALHLQHPQNHCAVFCFSCSISCFFNRFGLMFLFIYIYLFKYLCFTVLVLRMAMVTDFFTFCSLFFVFLPYLNRSKFGFLTTNNKLEQHIQVVIFSALLYVQTFIKVKRHVPFFLYSFMCLFYFVQCFTSEKCAHFSLM